MAEPDPNDENKRRMEALLQAKRQGHADRAATDHATGDKTKRSAPPKKEFRRRKV